MQSIRVLLAHLPGMLSDILRRAIAGEADMTVAGETADLGRLALVERGALPDVVIVGLEDGNLPSPCRSLLETCPRVKILVVAAGGRAAVLHEFAPRAIPVPEVSAEALLTAIRAAVRGPDNAEPGSVI